MKNTELKKISEYYDSRAKKSDQAKAAGQWINKEEIPIICEEIFNKIKIKKNYKVLEVGCGSGVLGNFIQKKIEFFAGLDISLHMLKKFQESSSKTLNLCQATTDSIPFSDKFFDVVILNGVTMYLRDEEILQKTFAEIQRVVKNDGIIFLGENIVPRGYYWELVWFQNSSKFIQPGLKIYIKFRRWLASKNEKYAGKWKSMHKEISPEFINQFFSNNATIEETNAVASTVRKKRLKEKYKGNRRRDFLIKLNL
ncbi:class I SAM-dependent methyltransferase [Nitrosopumilus sp.]|uniref:class I SAM-dependent methyltransferase n=1 Tax=Nitrosopumilus sp. TaxID=2024843 RepID=UPI002638ADE8|nr:class I SAM-dependent methyltransferase [Nitrosopumilus sp.]